MKQCLNLMQHMKPAGIRPKYSSVDNLHENTWQTQAANDQREPQDTAAMRSSLAA